MKKSATPSAYTSAGVNVNLGDVFSSFCGAICRDSYWNSKFVQVHDFSRGHFRGRRAFEFVNLPPGTLQTAGSDGIGTKTIVIDAAGTHITSSDNLLAMTAGDFTRDGSMPLLLLNHLDVSTLGKDENDPTFLAAKDLMDGLAQRAKEEGYVLFSGETAELSHCVTSENPDALLKYNWGAVMIGVMHKDKLITGNNIKEGDRVIAFRDTTRSNGLSLLRKGLRHRYGMEWYKNTSPEARASIESVATGSALYDNFLVRMNGWTSDDFRPIIKANLIAHLSGGGIQSKFGDDLLFPRKWSASLTNLWDPVEAMKNCASDLNISDKECYEDWGCGQGALIVVREKDAEMFVTAAGLEGIDARDAGVIKKTETGKVPSITLTSGFTGKKVILRPKKS